MKKFSILSTVVILSAIVLGTPVLAASIGALLPVSVNTTPGKTFTVVVSVTPQGSSDYAEKISLSFPAELLEVKSFTFAPSWMALTQTGYDVTDNVNGKLVKSAGYPNGINSKADFGTITFQAKKAGNATIAFASDSRSFQSSGESALTGTNASIAIAAPAPVVTPAATPAKTPIATQAPKITPVATPIADISSTSIQTSLSTSSDQAAALGDLNLAQAEEADAGSSPWLWVILVVIVLGIIIYIVSRRSSGPQV